MKKIVEALLTIGLVLLMLIVIMSTIMEQSSFLFAAIVVALYVSVVSIVGRKGIAICIGLYAIAIGLNWRAFIADTYEVLQQLAVVIAKERYIFLQTFEQESSYNGGLFATFLALLLTIAAMHTIQQRYAGGVLLLVISTIVFQIVMKTTAPIAVTVVFFAYAFMLMLYIKNASIYKKLFRIVFISVAIFALTVISLEMTNVSTAVVQKAMQTKLDSWRFNGDLSRLPNGQLQYATAQATAEDAALHVVMEQPTAMYLKGFIGTELVRNEWQRLEGAHYLQYKMLLDALQRQGFTNYNQFALAASSKEQSYQMSIQNVDADRRFGYVPYEAQQMSEAFTMQEGAAVTSTKWRGTSSYDVTYTPTTIQYYPKVANALYAQEDSSYLNMESYYNKFVYDSYLQLADDDRALLAHHMQVNEEEMTYEKAINYVQQFLAQNMKYSEKIAAVTSVQQLLEETKEGYAPHYATVATLLFRTLQIPARYVEGYIVTKQDVKGKSAFSEIPVAAQNAHAWTEIYIDKVGWIPVEVTPGYEEKMPPVNMDDYPAFEGASSSVQSEQVAGATKTEQVKDEKIDNEQTTPETTMQQQAYWWLLLLIPMSFIAFIIAKKLKRKNYLQAGTSNVQAVRYWAYLLYMLEREWQETNVVAISDNPSLQHVPLQQAQCTYEKAKYSGQSISEEELDMMKATVKTVKQTLQKNKKHLYKLPLLWRY